MRIAVIVGCLLLASPAYGDPPAHQDFTLYKVQNQIKWGPVYSRPA